MTEQDWLALSSADDLYGELAAVVQPRKLFQLGTAFLTPVAELLHDADRSAIDITRRYTAGKCGVKELFEAWTNAELATADGLWANSRLIDYHYSYCDCYCSGCPDCDPTPEQDREQIRLGVREGIRHPAWFAATSAFVAVEVGGNEVLPKQRKLVRQSIQRGQYRLFRDIIGDPGALPCAAPVPLQHHAQLTRLLLGLESQEVLEPLGVLALADAVEEAGGTDSEVLAHLRSSEPHFRGCWAIDRVAGRERIELSLDVKPGTPVERYEGGLWW
jgi:hypothetical protein